MNSAYLQVYVIVLLKQQSFLPSNILDNSFLLFLLCKSLGSSFSADHSADSQEAVFLPTLWVTSVYKAIAYVSIAVKRQEKWKI